MLKIVFPAGGALIKGVVLNGRIPGFHHNEHFKSKFIIRKQFRQ